MECLDFYTVLLPSLVCNYLQLDFSRPWLKKISRLISNILAFTTYPHLKTGLPWEQTVWLLGLHVVEDDDASMAIIKDHYNSTCSSATKLTTSQTKQFLTRLFHPQPSQNRHFPTVRAKSAHNDHITAAATARYPQTTLEAPTAIHIQSMTNMLHIFLAHNPDIVNHNLTPHMMQNNRSACTVQFEVCQSY